MTRNMDDIKKASVRKSGRRSLSTQRDKSTDSEAGTSLWCLRRRKLVWPSGNDVMNTR